MRFRVGGGVSVSVAILLTLALTLPSQALAIPFFFLDPTLTPTATTEPTEDPSVAPEVPTEPVEPSTEPVPTSTPTPTETPAAVACAPAPTDFVATAGSNVAELSWNPVAAEFAVTTYKVTLTPGERTIDVPVDVAAEAGAPVTAQVDGLRNGVEYKLILTAVNSCGEGTTSAGATVMPTSGSEGTVGQLVVKYESGVSSAVRTEATEDNSAVTEVGIEQGEKLGSAMQVLNLSEAVTEEAAAAIADTLAADSNIAWVEPNIVVTAAGYLRGLKYNIPAPAPPEGEAVSITGMPWDTYGVSTPALTNLSVDYGLSRGAGTVVAVIDTGITSHPDLTGNVLGGYDFVSDDATLNSPRVDGADPVSFDGDYVDNGKYGANGWDANATDPGDWRSVAPLRDSSWHGTVMAGIIGAQENPEHGTTGIAPETTILPVRALSWRGGLASDIAASITWASGGTVPGVADNPNPANVINLSFTVEGMCSPIFQDAINGAVARGAVIVAAAGNAGSDVAGFAPANCDNVITVGASDKNDKRSSYSNFGAGIDISAPGDGVNTNGQPGSYSLTNSGTKEAADADYAYAQGTSVSAAFVSGALARLKSQHPEATPSELSQLLIGTDVIRPFADDACDVDPAIECGPGISSVGFAQIAATTPTNFTGAGTPSLISLSWTPVTGATSYTLRWGTAANALTNVISAIPATATPAVPATGTSGPLSTLSGDATNGYQHFNLTFAPGQTFYYTLEAVDGAGASAATSTIAVTPRFAFTTSFGYTGAVQTYVVPAGVTILTVDMYGAGGGTYIPGSYVGGAGGRIQGKIAVTPGETLYFYVGGAGRDVGETTGGGFNGGAIGAASFGAGGGGATDIRRGTTLATSTRIMIAGGGGGAAYYSGGAGGGGTIGGKSPYTGSGAGGTQSTGGANFTGTPGTGNSGGGGGGGFYGGLGGGNYAGGGGGSSYALPSTVTGVVHTQGAGGTNSGNGSISVTVPVHEAMPAPEYVSVSGWQRSNTIQWTKTPANAATGYRIKWGTTPDMTETPIDVVGVNVTSYIHTARTFGSTYYYSVSTIHSNSTNVCSTACYSEYSPTVSVTTPFSQTATFNATGAVQTFTVPAGVNWIQVDAIGAGGGASSNGPLGGKGGRVQATVPVTPGEVINVFVGGSGDTLSRFPKYNGGGTAYTGNSYGGDGGGATDIRRGGTAIANRIVVAGGGGGGAYYSAGANGGGLTGADGRDNASAVSSGGTQTGPGPLGTAGTQTSGASALNSSGNSAGGGGGYWGGNAGAVGNSSGAGGSSWTTPAITSDGRYVTSVTHTQGFASATGDGSVKITYATTTAMPIPASFESTGFQSQVALKWVASKTDAVTGYKIKWGTSDAMTETPIDVSGAATDSYIHTGRAIGTTYYYSIAAVYTDATQSCNTACLSAYSPVTFTTPVFTEDLKFAVTGAVQQWTVPAGVTWIQVDAAGAGGEASSTGYAGGKGGRVQAVVPVTPGEVLNLYVGGAGGLSSASRWNGGGLTNNATGGNGGGASDIRRGGTAVANRILVAGAGGGASYYSAGGAGGGLIAANGLDNVGVVASGGNQIGPIPGAKGTPGALGVGASALSTSINSGGAGSGYWGGNAGTTNNSSGGGGSSWTTPNGVASDDARTIASIIHTQGLSTATGDGYITISVPTRAYPTGVKATGWQGYNTIQWDPTGLSGATAYKVYGGTSPNPTTLLATVNKGTEFYTHTNVSIGTTYYYRVTIVANGSETEKSAEVSAVPVPTKDLVFTYTGANQTWTVPAGVYWIQVDALGAAGDSSPQGPLGGKGGRVQATIPVTPGEVLNINVGNSGGAAVVPSWNGGGASNNAQGGRGGGASDLRRGGTALTNRILVAGGGGGASYYSAGGAGGGLIGANGLDNVGVVATGGTQVGPVPGAKGTPGTLGMGASALSTSVNSGGAGGGYWGGNAGTVNNSSGAGGSSWTIPTSSIDGRVIRAVTHTQGYASATGPGSIKITIPSSATPTGLVGAPGNNTVAVSWNASDATGLVGYKLYRGTTPNPTVQIGTTLRAPVGSTVIPTVYNDTSAVNGTTYYYRVAAVLLISSVEVNGPLSGDITAVPSALTVVPTFSSTGAMQSWTVPAGVSWVQVDASGASGGASSNGPLGGKGGRVQAAIPVTPGEVLNLYVGGAGGNAAAKGWNGGGAGNNNLGGAGGGASDIRRGGITVADRILVAGGGGGGAYYTVGGAGGGLVGVTGRDNVGPTASGGGQTGPIPGTVNLGTQSTPGVGSNAISSSINSAGGGGGYWGGNAGTVNNSSGGGGSSWTIPGAAGIIHTQGYSAGAGSITLSYAVDDTAPVVSAVTTPQANGVYLKDTEITVNVAFSESVLVAGTPTLTLDAGTRHPVLLYKSGSGTQTLSFVYRVSSGDLTSALDIDSINALSLNGGDISDRVGNAADVTLPIPGTNDSLAGDKTLIIDGDPPAAPQLLAASGSGSIDLDWTDNTESDLKEYRIYAGTTPTSLAQLSSVLSPNSAFSHFAVARGITYYYYVTAVDIRGNESAPSAMVSWGLALAGTVATPAVLADTPTNSLRPVLRGTTTPGATVSIRDAGVEIGTAVAGSDGNYTFTPTSDLTVASHNFTARATLDANISGVSAVMTVAIEQTPPTVTSILRQDPLSATTNADEVTFRVTFSEAMSGVGPSDFSPSGTTATVSRASLVAPGVYDVGLSGGNLGPQNGPVGLALASDSVMTDVAGNALTARTATTVETFTLDNNFPTYSITSTRNALSAGTTATLTFTLSKASTDFTLGDVSITKGSLSSWTAVSSTVYTAVYTPTVGVNGTETVTIRAGAFSDAIGMSNISRSGDPLALTLDTQAPVVTDVTSTTANASYKAGATVDVTVTFDETVDVLTGGGIPSLRLETGTTDQAANYLSGSGTRTLTFRYTVAAGDTTDDLNYVATTSLGLNGGTIKDAAGNAATLMLPAVTAGTTGALATNKAIVIDTTAPAAPTALALTPVGTSTANTLLAATTNMTASATIVAGAATGGSAGLYLGTTLLASDSTISSTDTSVSFTLGATSASELQAAITAGGSVTVKLTDLAGNVSPASTAVVLTVDYVLPSIVVGTSSAALMAGQTATLSFTLSEVSTNFVVGDITVTGGTLSGFAGSGKNYTATFTPTPNSSSTASISVASGVLSDAAGNPNTAGSALSIDVDTALPTVTGISSTTVDGLYGLGAVVNVTVTFSEAVIVNTASGTPTLLLETGSTDRAAAYLSGSGTNTLTFKYTVQAGDLSSGLNHQGTTALVLNSGTIKDAAGNAATLTLPAIAAGTSGALATNKALVIDTIAPAAPTALTLTPVGSTLANTLLSTTTNLTATATIAAGQATNGVASLMLGTTVLATDTTISSTDTVVNFTLGTTGAAALQAAIAAGGAVTVVLTDKAENTSTASAAVTLVVDYIVPTVTISSSSTSLIAGQTATLTFTLSEAAAASGAGAFAQADVTATGGSLSGWTAVTSTVFTAVFTPTAGTASASGAISIASGALTDAAGNPNAASNTVNVAVDTVAPTVVKFESSTANGSYREGSTIAVTATMSEQVRAGASLNIVLDSASAPFTLTTATAGTVLSGTYTVGANQTSADLTVSSFTFTAGAVQDAAGNALTSTTVPIGTNNIAGAKAIIIDSQAPSAATALTVTVTGGTVVANTLNSTNTNLTAQATITAGQATGGKAELLLGTSVIATDSSLGSGDTSVSFDLASSTTAALQSTIAAGGVLKVRVVDAALNESAFSNNVTIAADYIKPTVSMSSTKSSFLVGDTATVTFTLSEDATDFVSGDVTVTGGALSNWAGSGKSYTATFTPTAGVDSASPTVSVAAGAFTDAVSNPSTVSATTTFSADTKAPVVSSFTSNTADGTYPLGEVINVTANMSENVRPGSSLLVTLNTGVSLTLSTATSSNKLSGTFTVGAGQSTNDLTVTSITVIAGVTSDAAGNALTSSSVPAAPNNLGDLKAISFDLEAPTDPTALSFTAVGGNVVTGYLNSTNTNLTAQATITAGQASGGKAELLLGSIVIATDSNIMSTDTLANFNLNLSTAADLQAAIALGGNLTVRVSDVAGNTSGASTAVALALDYDKPTIAISLDKTALKSGETATVSFTLSDSTSDFTDTDITVTGGALSNFAGSGKNYTATFTPAAGSTATAHITVNADKYEDARGNPNSAAADTTVAVDSVDPTMTAAVISSTNATSTLAKAGDKLRVSVTTSEAVTVTGAPRVALVLGTTTVFADYVSGSGTSSLVFEYVVAAGDEDVSGGVTAGALGLNSGSIKDAAGNDAVLALSATSNSIEVDTTSPAVPTIVPVSVNRATPSVGGTRDADTTVKVYDTSVSPRALLGTASSSSNTAWSFTSSALTEGDHIVVAVAIDAAGNISSETTAVLVRVDLTAPTAPVISDVSRDSGRSTTDRVTNDTTLTVSGITEAGASVELFTGSTSVGAATADSSGTFSVTSTALSGSSVLTVKSTDAVGNTSGASAQRTYVIDTTAPSAPSITGPATTRLATPSISGTASADDLIEIFEDSSSLGTVLADGNGAWSVNLSSPLTDGAHQITATATDIAGNTGSASTSFTVNVDTTPPALSLAAVSGDNTISLAEKTAGVTLSGSTEAGVTVQVTVGSGSAMDATVTGASWTRSLSSSDIGTGTSLSITVTATDAAGNVSTRTSTAALNLAAVASPDKPDLLSADDSGTSNSDDVTNVKMPRVEVSFPVSGSTVAVAGQTLTLLSGGNVVLGQQILTSSDISAGIVTFTLASLNDNTYQLAATLAELGNTSAPSAALSLKIDSRVPDAPGAAILNSASDSGISNNDGVTKNTSQTVRVALDGVQIASNALTASDLIKIYDDGSLIETTSLSAQNLTDTYVDIVLTLSAGSHNLTAKASTTAGSQSPASPETSVVVDTTGQAAAGTPDLLGVSDSGSSSSDDRTNVVMPRLSVSLTGTDAVSNDTLQLLSGSNVLGSVVLTSADITAGTVDVVVTTALDSGSNNLTVRILDRAGNTGTASSALSVVLDDTAPAGGVVVLDSSSDSGVAGDSITSDATPTISVSSVEAGSTIVVTARNVSGTSVACTISSGTCDLGTLFAGSWSVTLVQTDAAGNESVESAPLNLTVDTVAPGAPSSVTFTRDSGSSNSDGVTNDNNLDVSGTAEVGSTVKLRAGSTVLGTTTMSASGIWSIATGILSETTNVLTAIATDAAGNESPSSSALNVTIDTTAPAAPVVSTTGETNDTTPTIAGTAEANAVVEISDGVTVLGTATANGSGAWSYTSTVLSEATHSLTARATDAAGNVSSASSSRSLTVDVTAPATPTVTPVLTMFLTQTVTGSAEAGSAIELKNGQTSLGTATATNSGTWSIATTLSAGSYNLTVVSTDAATNSSNATVSNAVVVDTTAPAAPVVTAGSSNTAKPTVTGTAEAGSTVVLYEGSTELGRGTADNAGAWSIVSTVSLGTADHTLTATAADAAGNTSVLSVGAVFSIDVTAPAAPSLNAITIFSLTPTLTGTTEAGATVSLYDGTTLLGTAVASSGGSYTFTVSLALANAAHSFTAAATDVAGNSGVASPVVALNSSWAAVLSGADATDNDNVSLTAVQYTAMGVTNIDSAAKASLLSDVLDAKATTAVNTVAELNDLARIVAAVFTTAAGGTPSPALSVADLGDLGLTGVTTSNLADILAAIAATANDGSGVSTLAALQNIVTAAAAASAQRDAALAIISVYAAAQGDTVPTATNYSDARVSGVDSSNLAALNTLISQLSPAESDTTAELQASIDVYLVILAGAEGTRDGDVLLTASQFAALDLAIVDSGAERSLINNVLDGAASSAVDTWSELSAIADAVVGVVAVEAGGSANPALTSASFAALGVTGVNSGNISEMLALIATAGPSADTVAELQALSDQVVADQLTAALSTIKNYDAVTHANPTPTEDTYTNAGISGVTSSTVAAINTAVDAISSTANKDTVSEIQAVVDLYTAVLSGADGNEGNNNVTLTPSQYSTLGLTVIDSAAEAALLNDVIDEKGSTAVDTFAELSSLATTVSEIFATAAGQSVTPAPSVSELTALGLSGVTSANIADVLAAIAATANDGSDVDSFAELSQVVSDAVAAAATRDAALAIIETYTGSNTAPLLGTYTDAQVTGVTSGTISIINTAIAELSQAETNTTAEIQAVADAYSAVIAGADGTRNSNVQLIAAQYLALDFTGINNTSAASLMNRVMDSAAATAVDTYPELKAYADVVTDVFATAEGASLSTELSVADFELLGITGVTESNIAAMRTAIAATANDGTGVDSLVELQEISDQVVADALANALELIKSYSVTDMGTGVASATLVLNISAGAPVAGAPVAFSASGLLPGAAYTLVVRSTPVVIDIGVVASVGTVSNTVTVPSGLPVGWHSLTFTSTDSNGFPVSSVLYFEITQSGTLQGTSTSVPAALNPTLADFVNAGVTGITTDNLAALNSILDATADAQKATVAQIQAIVNAYNLLLTGADSNASNNNVSLTSSQYSLLGLSKIDSSVKASLLNDVIDGLSPAQVDSELELLSLANTVSALFVTAADGTPVPALTAADLTALGLAGVTTDNLSGVLAAIAATSNNGGGVDTFAELSAVVDAAVASYTAAMAVISGYTGSNSAPTLSTYTDAGVTGVSAAELTVLNSFIAELSSSETDTAAEVQAVLTSVAKVLQAADGTANRGAVTITAADYVTLGIASINTASEVELLGSVIDTMASTKVDTFTELDDIASIVTRLMSIAAGGAASPALTKAHLATIGVTGVTDENLTALLATVAATTDGGSGIAPLGDLQAVIDDAITAARLAALATISAYGTVAPTLNDYVNAGVTGVTIGNLAGFNSFIAAMTPAQTDSVGEIQAAFDAYLALLVGADGQSNANVALTATEWSALGLGVNISSAAGANLVNDIIDVNQVAAVDTFVEVSPLATIVSKIMATSANPAATPALTLADFTTLGITGVTGYNLALIIAAIGATADSGADVDSLSELQALVSATATAALNNALTVLSLYDGTSGTTTPTINDYFNAGVVGVTADNLSYVNAALAQMTTATRDSTAEIQSIVDPFLVIMAGADGIDNNNVAITSAQYVAIGLTTIDTVAKASLLDQVIDISAPQAVDSMAELTNLGLIVRGIFVTATGGTPARALTPAHFAELGLTGVTDANLALVVAAIEATNDNTSGVDTLVELQTLITAVASAQNSAFDLISNFDGTGTAPVISDYLAAGVTGVSGSTQAMMDFFNSYIAVLPVEQTDSVAELQAIFDSCALIYAGADGYDNDNVSLTIAQYQALGFVDVGTQAEADAKNDFIDTFDIALSQNFESPEITAVAPADGKLDLTALLDADPAIAAQIDQTYDVDHFVYLVSQDDGTHWSDYGYAGTDAAALVVDGLTNGVEYTVKIRAVSPVATSLLSMPEVGVPVAAAVAEPVVIGRSNGSNVIPSTTTTTVTESGVVSFTPVSTDAAAVADSASSATSSPATSNKKTDSSSSGDSSGASSADIAGLLLSDPAAALGAVLGALFAPPSIDFAPGGAVANPAIGASGDDSAPVEAFDPLGSPESIAALGGALVMAAAVAAGVAAGVAGSAGGAAPVEGPASAETPGRPEEGGELEGLEATKDELTIRRRSWGDKLRMFAFAPLTFLDKFTHNVAIKVAPISPMLSKLIVDGAYLRAIMGSISLLFPLATITLASISVSANHGQILTPPWQLFLAMAVIGSFEAFAGFVGAVVFIAGTFLTASQAPVAGDYRMMFAVLFIMMGPALVMTAFRALRKDVEPGFTGVWERLSDFVIAPLMAGISVSTAVTVLPALAGLTLPVANHVADFGVFVAVAAALRVLLEELAAKCFPERLNAINPSSLPDSGGFQQSLAIVVSYGFWVFLSGAMVGVTWQVFVGSFFFLVPTILGKFSDRFPNSVWLWRIMPQGVPGLVFTLMVAAVSATVLMAYTGVNPEFAAWNMVVLPLPLLAISLLGMFGRHGASPDEVRFAERNPWLFRLGGVVIFVLALRMMGVI